MLSEKLQKSLSVTEYEIMLYNPMYKLVRLVYRLVDT